MTRLILASLTMLLCALPVSAATQTCIIVKLVDGGGAPLTNVWVTRDGANGKPTDASGVTFWCVAVSSTSCELRVDGVVSSAKASGGTASVRANVVYLAWLRGTDPVNVTITANATGTTPTPTLTPTRTYTPWPTATPGPSPTQAATHAPDMSVPNVLIEAAPMVQPGRFTYTWWPNQCDVEVFTADGDALSHDGPTWYSVEASEWIRFYVVPDPDLYPPNVVTRVVVVTATPGAPTPTPTRAPTATLEPDAAPDCAPTLTIAEAVRDLEARYAEMGLQVKVFPVILN